MKKENKVDNYFSDILKGFFNKRPQDIIVCTANLKGEPNVTIMGSPRIVENGNIEFEISEQTSFRSVTFRNIEENKEILFMIVIPGERPRDYKGVRVYAKVEEIQTDGSKLENIRNILLERYGEAKALELIATVTCSIKQIRPIVDRGQSWESSI